MMAMNITAMKDSYNGYEYNGYEYNGYEYNGYEGQCTPPAIPAWQ